MPKDILLAGIGIAAAPVAAWVTSVLARRKHDIEISKFRTEVDKMHSEVHSNELDNVREGNDILMKQIVEPLRNEIKYLRNDVNKFRRAIEKVSTCSFSADCPVHTELHAVEKDESLSADNQ